jgi:hypothetical protein
MESMGATDTGSVLRPLETIRHFPKVAVLMETPRNALTNDGSVVKNGGPCLPVPGMIGAGLAGLHIFPADTDTVSPVFVRVAAIYLRNINTVRIKKN